MIYSETNIDLVDKGTGMIPDKKIELNIKEFLNPNDIILDKALDWISSK